MNINKVESIVHSLFVSIGKARVFSLMFLSAIVMLSPALVQADMVFDFQMKLAKKGNAEAQYKVGEMYETGFGVEQDSEQAMEWVTKAANKNHETASFKLLYWDIEKNGMTNANKINLGSLKAKAKQDNPQASYYLGKMYARGVGLPKNSNSAIKLLNKAASVGIPAAETELAMVRERRQSQLAAKRRIDKQRADLKAKQERERQVRLEDSRKLAEQKQAQKLAAEKAQADSIAKQNAEKGKRKIALANEKLAREKAAEEKVAKEKQTLALEKERQLEKQLEKQRQAKIASSKKQAMMKKREKVAARQDANFESDPCNGKSARFLSTCR